MACCVLHNYSCHWNIEDELFQKAFNEMMEEDDLVDERDQDGGEDNLVGPNNADKPFMTDLREQLT